MKRFLAFWFAAWVGSIVMCGIGLVGGVLGAGGWIFLPALVGGVLASIKPYRFALARMNAL